jgi:hypothetical protein
MNVKARINLFYGSKANPMQKEEGKKIRKKKIKRVYKKISLLPAQFILLYYKKKSFSFKATKGEKNNA